MDNNIKKLNLNEVRLLIKKIIKEEFNSEINDIEIKGLNINDAILKMKNILGNRISDIKIINTLDDGIKIYDINIDNDQIFGKIVVVDGIVFDNMK